MNPATPARRPAQTAQNEQFRALYEANVNAILTFALRRVVTPADAADIVAETFLIAWRRLDDIPDRHEARLWLYGVARRVLSNYHRGEVRRHQLGKRMRNDLAHQFATPDLADEVVQSRAVRAALARLEPGDREVLELTVWEQLAPREIAVLLGVSAPVVRSRLSRARARLRNLLGDDQHDHQRNGAHHSFFQRSSDDPPGAGHVRDVRSSAGLQPGTATPIVPKEVR